jgi:hypothetical protein
MEWVAHQSGEEPADLEAANQEFGMMGRPRLVPGRTFPRYAYLPGRGPHPVRDPEGHSYGLQPVPAAASLDSEEFAWGQDLFNHGYYWEAHEAWEALWQSANRGSPLRAFLKGLILLSATGVKIRRQTKASDASRGTRRCAVATSDNGALWLFLDCPGHVARSACRSRRSEG